MYQIKCDDFVLYDPRVDDLIVTNPKCKLQVNTVGEASFNIYQSHPYFEKLQLLKSVFEISQDGDVIFRGRMTENSMDFDNVKSVDLEGAMAYFNDSVVRPFSFPEDFDDAEDAENVVAYFLKWLIENHNSQVQPFQKFEVGTVTVSAPNNYLSRIATDHASTWETLKSKLFDSALGGYLCIRYGSDGNYIDYLSDFDSTNIQKVRFGENLLNIARESDASATYSAMIPLGYRQSEPVEGDSTQAVNQSRLTIKRASGSNLPEDIVKFNDYIYSKSAVAKYGFIFAPTKDTTWDDITDADNLLSKGVETLSGTGTKMSSTIELTALDLHYSDSDIEAFRIYKWIVADSKPHGLTDNEGRYRLTALDIDIMNPQNTKITLGDTSLSLTDLNAGNKSDVLETVLVVRENIKGNAADIADIRKSVGETVVEVADIHETVTEQTTNIVSTCENIIFSALESYTKTGDYETFKQTVEAQLLVLTEEIALKFTTVTDSIERVNDDLQEKYNTITKYFTFSADGLTIGEIDNPYKIIIDNDRYSMTVNDVEILWIANGKVYTPEISVSKKMDIFGYRIEKDESGNLNCEYVGG